MPVYGLLPDKGGRRLKAAETEPERTIISVSPKGRRLTGSAAMASLTSTLSGIMDRPVLDLTGIAGSFEIDTGWTPDERESNSILGLKVATARAVKK